ncbi:MAG TPA: 4Fe-4S binding protein [Victivallales bacterium]|nr:4Fe-4S binding protein [Victivallales bacterium]
MPALVDPEICTGCESCISVCPVEAITMKDGKAVVDSDECIECGACIDECPVDAITMK